MKYSLFSTERQVTLLYIEVPYGPLIEKQTRHERNFKPEAFGLFNQIFHPSVGGKACS